MKNYVYFAFLGLALVSTPVFAADQESEKKEEKILSPEEAKEAVMSLPTAKDAVSGTVPTEASALDYYDIYGRQLAYRENVKAYRASLESRRTSFVGPQVAAIERYRDTITKVYEAETEAAAKANALAKPSAEKNVEQPTEESLTDAVAGADHSATEEDAGLREEPIPSHSSADEQGARRKVVTSKDAPDFDPSDL